EQYDWLFESLVDFAVENEINLNSPKIITDFELAEINASQYAFLGVTNKTYFFYLEQNAWKRIQCYGLARTDAWFSLKIKYLLALAFLSPQKILSAFNILKPEISEEAKNLVLWLEETYVLVYESLGLGIPRTQNAVEG
ncbi:25515_t:CDS:2, partial [Dentiscutata erythropus]